MILHFLFCLQENAFFDPSLWFIKLFGFKESVSLVRKHLSCSKVGFNVKIMSDINNISYNAGNFQIRNISSFLNKFPKLPIRNGGSFNILSGKGRETKNFQKIDAFSMQSLPENDGATYLAASNFNCLEFTSRIDSVRNGVTDYIYDNTQGPYTALACPQSAVYRNYFYEHPNKNATGQLKEQINLLSKTPLKVENGYAIISTSDTSDLVEKKFNWSDENNYPVGVHNNCDVLLTRASNRKFKIVDKKSKPIIANHVYAASFNLYDDVVMNNFTLQILQHILEAEYKSTILSAWENSIKMEEEGRQGAKKLFLTLLGGGVFGNPKDIIAKSIISSKDELIKSGLEVYAVAFDEASFNDIKKYLIPLVNETNGKIISIE